MKKNIKFGMIVAAMCYVLSPQFTHAAGLLNSGSTLGDLINGIIGIFRDLVPLLIGAAIVVFLWGVLVFIAKSSAGDADGRREGINFMIYGIIGIAVMVSVWGLVMFVTSTLGTTTAVPQFNTTQTGANDLSPSTLQKEGATTNSLNEQGIQIPGINVM